jgi:amino acid transporter
MMASDDEKQTAKLGQPELGTVGSIQEIYPSQGNALVGGLHRRLNNRQIQLIAAGGSIGTALFISIGGGLAKGGPASLVIAYTVYSIILAFVNNSIAEMNTYMPVAGGFVRLAGYWVDDALGFLAGWNFFIYEALIIPFEVTALTFTMSFWSEEITTPGPTAGVCAAVIVLYG